MRAAIEPIAAQPQLPVRVAGFEGHPALRHLYLPFDFEGHPLRKDFPLLAREVKPWPGLVDVEGMPGEPAEAEGAEGAEGEGGA